MNSVEKAGGADRFTTLDELAAELRLLREQAGPVSFAELARRIGEVRVARGITATAAVPARSTVHSVFSAGRARMDTELVRDIVIALGESEESAELWVRRCRRANTEASQVHRASSAATAAEAAVPSEVPLPNDDEAEPFPAAARPGLPASAMAALDGALTRRAPLDVGWWVGPTLVIAAIAVNLLGEAIARNLGLPIYLDMLGTTVVALLLGPWWGVAVAGGTGLMAVPLSSGDTSLFTLAAVAGALVLGYGTRAWGLGTTMGRYLALCVLTAVACSAVSIPILLGWVGGGNGHAADLIAAKVNSEGVPIAFAIAIANLVTSVMDKVIVGFLALPIFVAFEKHCDVIVPAMPLVGTLWRSADAGAPGSR